MPALRFNHMELTLPPGALERDRDAIVTFYSEVFGFNAIEVPLFDRRVCCWPQTMRSVSSYC